jgi:rod shape determining protein RodA
MLWFAGIGKKFFVILFLSSALMAPVMWGVLKPYQKKRIIVFLGEGDARNERYQLEQSKIAIGSGGLTGKGLLKGTQNQLRFLPESRTDFIFSIICEEWGFTGALIILSLYLVLFIRFLFVVPTIQSPFVQLLAVGLITPLMVSTVVNICMVIGFLPIVGIPLPLISYGISSLWITFASLGWFHNIAIRRFYIGEY